MGLNGFTVDLCDSRSEALICNRLASPAEMERTLYLLHDKLGSYNYFNASYLMHHPYHVRLRIAVDYLLSEQGLISEYMAKNGCYRIPVNSSNEDKKAMRAYVGLLEENISKKSRHNLRVKEAYWNNGTEFNFIWKNSPADPEYWNSSKYEMASYYTTYGTGSVTVREDSYGNVSRTTKNRSSLWGLCGLAILVAIIIFCVVTEQDKPATPYVSNSPGYSSYYSSNYSSSASSSSTKSSGSSSKSNDKSKPKNWDGSTLPISLGTHITDSQIGKMKRLGAEPVYGKGTWVRYRIEGQSNDYVVWLDENNDVAKTKTFEKTTKKNNNTNSNKGSKKKTSGDYDKDAFPDAEEFQWWYADDFDDLFDAEDYWDD